MNAPVRHELDLNRCAAAFRAACELDVLAFKPGNVSVESAGHGMRAEDFLISAEVAAPHIADPSLNIGERIYRAVEATRRAVACNTNLGIVLLAAPLIHAAQQLPPDGFTSAAFSLSLRNSLHSINLAQTELVYRAIRLAAPGGLGGSRRHDVNHAPKAPLLTAMREASRRDCIARQYANDYADLFSPGRDALTQARARRGVEAQALSELFIAFLADFPDSHVQRKHGMATAEGVRQMARQCQYEVRHSRSWKAARKPLEELDQWLKTSGINPGTSADLSVATWLLDRLLGESGIQTETRSNPTRLFGFETKWSASERLGAGKPL
jgi:triphosphoribosyl-dephospho-CoA synthase